MADGDPDTIETADEDEEFVRRTARPPPLVIKGVGNMTLYVQSWPSRSLLSKPADYFGNGVDFFHPPGLD